MKSSKKTIFFILILISISAYSQQRMEAKFGEPTYTERQMVRYDKDPNASAVVLFEGGKNYFELVDNKIRLVKEVHRKIKVFDPNKFDQGNVEILYFQTKKTKEKVIKIKAITHNGELQTFVADDAVYDIDLSENWSAKRFAFSNIKKGSILEYTYRIESPFFFNFGGWDFQGDLPKIYTEFNTIVSGNFHYQRVLYGDLKLYLNDVSIKVNCFSVPGSSSVADCEVALYAMEDVPAFKEESYMLSKQNYIARIVYELSHTYGFDGLRTTYTKKWRDVDRELKHEQEMGIQLGSGSFFKNNIPESILTISDPLERAKSIYYFIQDRMSWDGQNGIFTNFNVKRAFEAKTGNTAEINIALINALQAADLDANIVISSTRDYGLPTTKHPVLTDYNYVSAFLTIGENKYVLDATNKIAPFEVLPFKVLNVQGRVMDFKEGSYWHQIQPFNRNVHYVNSQLVAEEDGTFSGKVSEIYNGHIALEQREKIIQATVEGYKASKKSENANTEIENLTLTDLHDNTKSLREEYSVVLDSEIIGDKTYVYPVFMKPYFEESPFLADTRKYPINFGFPVTNTYMVSLDLNDHYEAIDLPKSRIYKLPNDGGECSVIYSEKNGGIQYRLSIKLNEYKFQPEEYEYLKEFFLTAITMQNKEPIVLKYVK